MGEGTTVAVIGLGALGLVSLKNLAEEGYVVTGFERNGYVGGLWNYTEEDKTSVLQSTIVNISKERGCFTDFPFERDVSSYPSAAEVQAYLLNYVDHFKLSPNIRLNTCVKQVRRDQVRNKWALDIEGAGPEHFDKVVIAIGMNSIPNIPVVEGIESFGGVCVHSRAFKRPDDFVGKKVLIVGLGNTGADTATSLIGYAEEIFIAHREGTIILPRVVDGKSLDHSVNFRLTKLQDFMNDHFPDFAEKNLNKFVKKIQDKAFTIDPKWNLSPAPSLKQSVPVVSDTLVTAFESGSVQPVSALRKVVQENAVELADGTHLAVDSIIWCTGYKTHFGLVEDEYDPTKRTTAQWAASRGSNGKPLPRLYQNIFSLERPDSLAFMGTVAFPNPAFQIYDLASMALAQVWKGRSSLPSRASMEAAVDAHHEWVCGLARRGSVYPGIVKPQEWMRWVNEAAGTGVDEYLGYGWKGWAFWAREPRFCNLLMTGIYSPHVFRVFDGKKKKWDGARLAIERANEDVKMKKVKLL
ncbi:flavin monooxygenase-like protein [Lineolata rhizophorae]|uniref:Flavin monooxygenase-like protein n=1 Tax=Lineolata rhizophorae TaxID=578093 RepID=A0A6A6P893_9PEZI|nr:flavin monooxygenase-like protein [Lineolata rhizophorae]